MIQLVIMFCGFFINGGESEMFNNATATVLMRQGTRTVLSMQNNYQGPPSDFAMVIPVPVVLHEGDVKTLPRDIFDKIDNMGAPRLVEYWEQDPCPRPERNHEYRSIANPGRPVMYKKAPEKSPEDYQVTVEAKFEVGEYQIVILSAKDSSGLEAYLKDAKYKIPPGAEPLLRPYVETGSKFFVARVDPKKVEFVDGQAQLSPLRFHYDSDEFTLPIRLGLANANGKQDLIISILAPSQRYELANYPNVVIPTNFDVKDEVRSHFGEFYASLFDRTLQMNPGAIVTEYAWDAGTCDPCPGPQIDDRDLLTLGNDQISGQTAMTKRRGSGASGNFVLTRLHARYDASNAPNDLVFRAAAPITGGRSNSPTDNDHGASPSSYNNFQGRYIIKHDWVGDISCANPVRGRWGGPPNGVRPENKVATKIAFAPRGSYRLWDVVEENVPEVKVEKAVAYAIPQEPPKRTPRAVAVAEVNPGELREPPPPRTPMGVSPHRCGCAAGPLTAPSAIGLAALVGAVGLAIGRRRRRR